MREQRESFEAAGLRVVVVGQATPEDLQRFLEGRDVPFETYCDPDLGAYRAYGLARGTLWQVVFAPKVIAEGIAAYQEGHKVEAIVGDPMQLPGSFVVSEGKIVFAHRGQTAADIAPPADLLAALR